MVINKFKNCYFNYQMGLKLYIIPDNFRNHFINENFSYQISMKLIDFKIIV